MNQKIKVDSKKIIKTKPRMVKETVGGVSGIEIILFFIIILFLLFV